MAVESILMLHLERVGIAVGGILDDAIVIVIIVGEKQVAIPAITLRIRGVMIVCLPFLGFLLEDSVLVFAVIVLMLLDEEVLRFASLGCLELEVAYVGKLAVGHAVLIHDRDLEPAARRGHSGRCRISTNDRGFELLLVLGHFSQLEEIYLL